MAGVDLAGRVRAAVPAGLELYRQVEAFATGEHGQTLRAYWAAHDAGTAGLDESDGMATWRCTSPRTGCNRSATC